MYKVKKKIDKLLLINNNFFGRLLIKTKFRNKYFREIFT